MKKLSTLFGILLFVLSAKGQQVSHDFRFALVTDTHIGSSTGEDDLRKTVRDINRNDSLSFVVISGDVTEFGSDAELLLAKQVLDSIKIPWYVIPGNHDTKWSESGGLSFKRIFGSDRFCFEFGDFIFVGINSGPNMRMSPGQIPVDNLIWLDSLLKTIDNHDKRVVLISHYPIDESLNNWYLLTDLIKTSNIQVALCGHGHSNRILDLEGIPGLMGRSNLRGGSATGGYNIFTISGDTLLKASEKICLEPSKVPWTSVKLLDHHYESDTISYPRPDYSVNNKYKDTYEAWRSEGKADIGSGAAIYGKTLIYNNISGDIIALKLKTGKEAWSLETHKPLYSTPLVCRNKIITAGTDGIVYGLDARSGKADWTFDAGEYIVSSPVTDGENVFIAGSGGKCYWLRGNDGKELWRNYRISGFVETKPLIYKNVIYFGTWNNHFYGLDKQSGKIIWDWHVPGKNRNLSPAACVPVAADDMIFVVAPDRVMTCLSSVNGEIIWRTNLGGSSVRESMGISEDSTLVYAKTMDGQIIGVPAVSAEGTIKWRSEANTGYDISPAVITEYHGFVFIPTDKGFVYAVDRKSSRTIWIHRISSCLVCQILPVSDHEAICITMDGVVTRLNH